jgi:hypothetical protein
MKTPQQIRNEVEKGCGEEIVTIGTTTYEDEYEDEEANTIYCGDYNNELCPKCKAQLSILTEYDKSIKKMIENLDMGVRDDWNIPEKYFLKEDVAKAFKEMKKELLSKIGDDSEVEK